MPTTPAAKATSGVEMLTVERPARKLLLMWLSFGNRSSAFKAQVITPPTTRTTASPQTSANTARPASRHRSSTSAVAAAVIGSVSGLIAIAPTTSVTFW